MIEGREGRQAERRWRDIALAAIQRGSPSLTAAGSTVKCQSR